MDQASNRFKPFLFSINPKLAVNITSESEYVKAVYQMEYFKYAEGRTMQVCA